MSTDAVSGKVLLVNGDGFTATGRINRAGGGLIRIRGHVATDGGEEAFCQIDRIPVDASIRVGDEVITSGMGGVFPSGIPIGVVVSVDETASPLERTAILQPYADLERLDTVFVLMENEEAGT